MNDAVVFAIDLLRSDSDVRTFGLEDAARRLSVRHGYLLALAELQTLLDDCSSAEV